MVKGLAALIALCIIFIFALSFTSCSCEKEGDRKNPQPQTPKIFLVLDRIELSVGETLGVSVEVENVKNVYGVALDLTFDSEAFELTSSRAGEFLKPDQKRFLANFQSDDSNRLVVGTSKVGDVGGASGGGIVACFELKAKRAGSYHIALDRVALKNPELASIEVEVGNQKEVRVK